MRNIYILLTLFLFSYGCSKENVIGDVINTDFADPLLYIYMQSQYDTNADYIFQPEEVLAVTSIDLSKQHNFASLKGLEKFVNLEVLNLSGQKQANKQLKVTNPKLMSLTCSGMGLNFLDVTKLPELTELDCTGNGIVSLDISSNKKLKKLTCQYTNITSLDLSSNLYIGNLDCSYTKVETINLDNCKELQYLNCSFSKLASIDLSSCEKLVYLDLTNDLYNYYSDHIALASLDISKNIYLEELLIDVEKFFVLDISNNPHLRKVRLIVLDPKDKFTFYIQQGQSKPDVQPNMQGFSYEFQYK